MTFNLEFSMGLADICVDDGVITQHTSSDRPRNTPQKRNRKARSMSLGEAALTDTIVEDDGEVEFEVCGDSFTRGTARNHLADSLMKKRVIMKILISKYFLLSDGKLSEIFMHLPDESSTTRWLRRSAEMTLICHALGLGQTFNADYLGEKFLVGDVRVGDKRHMMFATADQLCLLQRTRTLYLDGTFRVVNKPFTQLWSIHAFLRQGATKHVPLLCVLMSRRRKNDYEAVVLRKIVELMDVVPVVEAFAMDIEAGLWQAFQEVFPRSKLHGCGFHWAQVIQRRVQAVWLHATYERREGDHQYVRKVLALPFLALGDIPRAFRKLKDCSDGSSEQLRELFHYVSDQWIDNSMWSPDEWSVYRKNVRTNNDTEGKWHLRMNARAGRGKLKFYILLGLRQRRQS
ncbi:hypothetical protein MAR_015665 [Mya arenaria]|uniref:MULE transposase domain-containing protein n=1 Tax=Mya arenaria TaxID=6604 RepID=A0ABY7FL84_MYAAR|nr:hypothetical protein MAR_015665 [Mya arenaria]